MSVDVIAAAAEKPSRLGAGARRYIGPKAQTTIDERLWQRTFREAEKRGLTHTAVMREIVYAGILATGRATEADVSAACSACGIDFERVLHLLYGDE